MKSNFISIGNSNNQVITYDLRNPNFPLIEASPMNQQIRCVSIFPDLAGYIVGTTGGRCGVQHFHEPKKNFSFKCHRPNQNDVYPVNDIDFHPYYQTFATVGSGK